MVIYKLEGVPIAGDNDTVPAMFAADSPGSAQNVICFPAGKRIGGDVHGTENVFENRHLGGQLIGHGLSGGLVALVGGVSEGRAFFVKGNSQRLRLLGIQKGLHDVQKTIDGACGLTGFGGQVAYPVKGTVDDAVAV